MANRSTRSCSCSLTLLKNTSVEFIIMACCSMAAAHIFTCLVSCSAMDFTSLLVYHSDAAMKRRAMTAKAHFQRFLFV